MRFTTFLIFFLFSFYLSPPQKIHFADTTNIWRVVRSYNIGNTIDYTHQIYSYKAVVRKNGLVYYSLSSYDDSALIREDTVNKRIYAIIYRNKYYGHDTSEILLYDFSLKLGDTMICGNDTANRFIYRAVHIDSVMINNVYHKVFQLEETRYYYSQFTAIEGIGTLSDPILPSFGFYFEEGKRLVCFGNNGNNPLISPTIQPLGFDNLNSCKDTTLIVSALQNTNNIISIYPQPANKTVTIHLPASTSGSIDLYNTLGQRIYHAMFGDKQNLEINNENWHGVYMYRINAPDYYTGKLVFE